MDFKVVNLEQDNKGVDQALFLFEQEIEIAPLEGVKVIKYIHGYGSSGKGGAILKAVRLACEKMKRQGKIEDYIFGSQWHISNKKTINALKKMSNFSYCEDLNHSNLGITVVVLK